MSAKNYPTQKDISVTILPVVKFVSEVVCGDDVEQEDVF